MNDKIKATKPDHYCKAGKNRWKNKKVVCYLPIGIHNKIMSDVHSDIQEQMKKVVKNLFN